MEITNLLKLPHQIDLNSFWQSDLYLDTTAPKIQSTLAPETSLLQKYF